MKKLWQELIYRFSLGFTFSKPMSKRGAKLLRENRQLGWWIIENRDKLSKP